jgi:hypothetical protein
VRGGGWFWRWKHKLNFVIFATVCFFFREQFVFEDGYAREDEQVSFVRLALLWEVADGLI